MNPYGLVAGARAVLLAVEYSRVGLPRWPTESGVGIDSMARKRDYAAEYARRIARGRAAGKSRQAARGHARGEGRTVRRRPSSKAERQAGRERGRTLRDFADAILRGRDGRSRSAGLGSTAFKHSLGDRRIWGKTGDIVFTFRGIPAEGNISPKQIDEFEETGFAYEAVPVRLTALDPLDWWRGDWPPTIGDVLATFPEWVDFASGLTSLIEPELADVYVIQKSLR